MSMLLDIEETKSDEEKLTLLLETINLSSVLEEIRPEELDFKLLENVTSDEEEGKLLLVIISSAEQLDDKCMELEETNSDEEIKKFEQLDVEEESN